MLVARLNLGITSDDQEEIDLYNNYKKYSFKSKLKEQ